MRYFTPDGTFLLPRTSACGVCGARIRGAKCKNGHSAAESREQHAVEAEKMRQLQDEVLAESDPLSHKNR